METRDVTIGRSEEEKTFEEQYAGGDGGCIGKFAHGIFFVEEES